MKQFNSSTLQHTSIPETAAPDLLPVSGQTATYIHEGAFRLESGQELPGLEITYTTFGRLNSDGSNVVWVCHALTGNSLVLDWWPGLFGKNCLFDPEQHFIVCANVLGSCYGSTGPLSVHPHTGQPWFGYFPSITVRDMVQAHELLRRHLAITRVNTLIGASLGAQQALEWSFASPDLFQQAVIIAGNSRHSAWGIAFNESQRMAIKADRTYYANCPTGGEKGLAAARSIALLSYRNYDNYCEKQTEPCDDAVTDFRAASYQRYQGRKLCDRFNAYSYVALLHAMDSHHLGRGRGSLENVLGRITVPCLVVGITSDVLFPLKEQIFLARHLANASLCVIDSEYGHDGFLLETEQLSRHIKRFISSREKQHHKSNLTHFHLS